MLNNLLLWIFAPGAYLWFDRGSDASLKDVVTRWRTTTNIGSSDIEEADLGSQLHDRYLSIFGLCGAVFAYVGPVLLLPIFVGIHLSWGGEPYGPIDDFLMKIGLYALSFLGGLIIPLVVKAMYAQHDWRQYLSLKSADQADFVPRTWVKPGNVDLLLAIPGFMFFVSIWWGR